MSTFRYALRTLMRRPAPTLVVVVTLAVAISAITVIYSAIDVVWHLIPVMNRAGLLYAASTDTRVVRVEGEERSVVLRSRVSVPDLADWAARSSTFDQFAGLEMGSANLTGIDVPLRVSAIRVTANLPELWGLTPTLGRSFRPEEGGPGATPVALLTYVFWQRQFASTPGVLGQSLLLDGVAHTVVGVLPSDATTGLLRDADVFLPLALDPLRGARDEREVLVTGRLKAGVTRAQAEADLEAIARQLQSEHPSTNQRIGASVLPLIEASGFNVRVLLSILGLIALLVLVMACANVASVIVAQSLDRGHELAVRAALGASRLDRIGQLIAESALVSVAAGAVGVVLAAWGVDALRWLGGDAFGLAEIRMNGRVLFAALLTTLAAPVGFGVLPALRFTTPSPLELRDGGRAAGGTFPGRRTRSLIVALQAAAAMILMLQIGLLVRTTWALNDIPSGFDPSQVLTFHVGLSGSRYEQPRARDRFSTDLLSRLRALPGVVSVGIIDHLPISDREPLSRLTVEGAPPAPLEGRPLVARAAIAGDYFGTMRIPVAKGRVFSDSELSDASPVALVNEEAARRFWPGRDPLGSRLALDSASGDGAWLQVVGIVGNLRNSDADQGPLPAVYVPASGRPSAEMAVVVKSVAADPLQLAAAARIQVAQIDRDQPIHDVASMSQVLFDDLAGTYVLTAMLTAIGLVALCLSAAGIYGLVAYSVAKRAREIGIRMALGARPGTVIRMVVAGGVMPVATGGLVGLGAAAALAETGLSVPGVDARDPINYTGVVLTIGLVALAASYLPGRRAARVDPVVALRQE
jgi:predicted permease